MNSRALIVGLAALTIGVVLIAFGWALRGTKDFLPALLLELGASFFLVVPLLVFERLLSGRIRETREAVRDEVDSVREQVRDTTRRLDELDARYGQRQGAGPTSVPRLPSAHS